MKTQLLSIFAATIVSLVAACGGEMEPVDHYVVLGKADNGTPPAVQLVYADSWNHQKYGQSSKFKNFVIRVQNLAYHKEVSIHHRTASGEWVDTAATYSRSVAGDGEIWLARMMGEGFGGQFVVKYATEGVTYWDNNNGRNYHLGEADGPMLGVGVNVRVNSGYYRSYGGSVLSFRGTIDVRNRGYHKNVNVHYSTDGWQTEKVVKAGYMGAWRVYGYSGVENPNAHGVEGWTFETEESADKLEYYVSYEVDGQTHRDTNHGENYTLYK
ncbi:MAG: hypothetical protein JRH20_20760 [Deltaproteobacteria bacterium]|nr:hypothetical protein [Deltaproteobacteria bacterium]